MRRKKVLLRIAAVVLLCLPIALWSVESAKENGDKTKVNRALELKQQIEEITAVRDAAIGEINNRYRTAPQADRVTIEAEGARIQADYERTYLSVLVEYHKLNGNQIEMEKAQQNLDAINGKFSENQQLDKQVPKQKALNSGTEGVVINEKN